LNCLNRVVHLHTGNCCRNDREFLITKLCPAAYDEKAAGSRFHKVWAMGENPEKKRTERTERLASLLQRAFGYAPTADDSEKAVFVFYGHKGNNGRTSEVEKEHKLNQGRIKYMTAGMGSIKSCRATLKLFLDGNYRRVVRGVDDAIRRRLIPFDFTVRPED
jgi:phage/plasmid-associated DNA primase